MSFRLSLIMAVLALLSGSPTAHAATSEYQAKAALLYKFALFVDWPPNAFPAPVSPFVACVLGENPFGRHLRQEFGDHRVGRHPVEIREVECAEKAGDCHLVFIPHSAEDRLQRILHQIGPTGVLTVSDIDNFARRGGMIGLVRQGNRVRFELNVAAANGAGLEIGAGLQRVALTVLFGRDEEKP